MTHATNRDMVFLNPAVASRIIRANTLNTGNHVHGESNGIKSIFFRGREK
jgi:hypothetical protein